MRIYFYGQKVPEDIMRVTNAKAKFRSFVTLVFKRKAYVRIIPIIGRSCLSVEGHGEAVQIDFKGNDLRVSQIKWLLFFYKKKGFIVSDSVLTVKADRERQDKKLTYTGKGAMFSSK